MRNWIKGKVNRLRDAYGIRNHATWGGGDSKMSGEEPPVEVLKHPR